MIVLRYLYVLALVVWLGGTLAVGGLAEPSIFGILPQSDAVDGAALAGVVFGDILRRFHVGAYACGGIMLGTLVGMRLLGPKPVQFNVRIALVASMLAVAGYSGLVVSGQIDDLQRQRAGPTVAAGRHDRLVSFERLHGLSMALLLVNVAGGLSLLYWEARE